ncbi:MAG TPA: ankyrin repeat domain-containing protein [Arachidicoccus sp.]|nr:ankyrin repeat domain-containing protein [Arachidicoccus sp.]
MVIDPNTGKVLDPDQTDIGHKPGKEWRVRKRMHQEKGSTRKLVIEEENDPELYQLEDRRKIEVINMKKEINNRLPERIVKAIMSSDIKIVEEWQSIDSIDNVDRDKRSAIFYAVICNSAEIVLQLLKSNPNLNLKDGKGWSPLHYAAQDYLVQIASLLLENGVDIELKDDYGNTPLWRATYTSKGKGEMIRLLLSHGAERNNPNDSGICPLELAETIQNYNVIQFFD